MTKTMRLAPTTTDVDAPFWLLYGRHVRTPVSFLSPVEGRRYHDGSQTFPSRVEPPPPEPDIVDGQEHFFVEAFRNKRGSGRRSQWLVKYLGFPEEENEWWSASTLQKDLSADAYAKLVAEYEQRVALIPAKKPRSRART